MTICFFNCQYVLCHPGCLWSAELLPRGQRSYDIEHTNSSVSLNDCSSWKAAGTEIQTLNTCCCQIIATFTFIFTFILTNVWQSSHFSQTRGGLTRITSCAGLIIVCLTEGVESRFKETLFCFKFFVLISNTVKLFSYVHLPIYTVEMRADPVSENFNDSCVEVDTELLSACDFTP